MERQLDLLRGILDKFKDSQFSEIIEDKNAPELCKEDKMEIIDSVKNMEIFIESQLIPMLKIHDENIRYKSIINNKKDSKKGLRDIKFFNDLKQKLIQKISNNEPINESLFDKLDNSLKNNILKLQEMDIQLNLDLEDSKLFNNSIEDIISENVKDIHSDIVKSMNRNNIHACTDKIDKFIISSNSLNFRINISLKNKTGKIHIRLADSTIFNIIYNDELEIWEKESDSEPITILLFEDLLNLIQ